MTEMDENEGQRGQRRMKMRDKYDRPMSRNHSEFLIELTSIE